ncbi:MAG: InlB B-repeat-containing protein [Lachnospiraceae bacterium]|nr:InlB B-repeat-containing protein [Lachnospiraceae bacterium]
MKKYKKVIAYLLVFSMLVCSAFVTNPNVVHATDNGAKTLSDIRDSAVDIELDDEKTASVNMSASFDSIYVPVSSDAGMEEYDNIGLYHFTLGANESYRLKLSYGDATLAKDTEGAVLCVYQGKGADALTKPYICAGELSNEGAQSECVVTNSNEDITDCYLMYSGINEAVCDIEPVLSVESMEYGTLIAGDSVSGLVSDTVYSYVVSPESGSRTVKTGTGALLRLDIPERTDLIIDVGEKNSLYIYDIDALGKGTYQGLNISRVSLGRYSIGNWHDAEIPVYIWIETTADTYNVTAEIVEEVELTGAEPLYYVLRPTKIEDLVYNIKYRDNYVEGNYAGNYIEGLAYTLTEGTYGFNFSYEEIGGMRDDQFNNSHLYIINPTDGSYEIETFESNKKSSYSLVVPHGETRYIIFTPGAEGDYYGGTWTMELGGFEDASGAFNVPSNPKDVYIYGWDNELEEYLKYFYEVYPQYKEKVHFVNLDVKGQSDKYKTLLNDAAKGSEKPSIIASDLSMMDEMKALMVPVSSLGITKKMYNSYLYEELVGSDAQGLKGLAGSVQPGCFIYRTDIAEEILGTSEPEEVEKKISDWESFLVTASDMKSAGYYMTSGSDRLNELAKGFDSETDYYGQLITNGYDTGSLLGSDDWRDDLSGNVFGFFGSISMLSELDSEGSYKVCTGPLSFSFGGTYIGGTSEAVGNPLAGLVLYTLCCDPYVMYKMADNRGMIPNSTTVIEKLIKENKHGFTGDEYAGLGGQNPLEILDSAEKKRGEGIGPYNISYMLNSGKNNPSNPASYSRYTGDITLYAPSRAGYTFAGWYTDAAFTTKITKIPKGNSGEVKLYAKWTANKYTIQFLPNGATKGTMKKISATYDVSKTLSSNAFKRTGYTFAGWNTRSDGKGKNYKNKAAVKNLTTSANGTVKLYATWKATKYTVKYYLRGGKNNSKNPKSYYVTTATRTLKKPTRTGYTFVGWYSDAKYTKKVKSIKKGSTGNKKLYAKWRPNKYKIVFKGNGATSGKMTSLLSRKYGTVYRLPANKFVRDGYTFIGWSLKPRAKKIYKNKAKIKNLSAKSGGTVTLYARWKKK